MSIRGLSAVLAVIVSCVMPHGLAAETLKIASPIRGSWEGAIPELGQQAGIFRKYGLDLDILYTQGGGETLQVVMSGSVDIGLSAGALGSLGAYGKGAPLRVIGASSTGSRETFWWVAAKSPLAAKKDAFARYMKAYNETVDWMYSSAEAVPRYLAFSGLSEPAVRLMLKEFIPKESLQTEKIMGLGESMKDAVQFKFLSAPLSETQLKELIQIP